MMEHRRLRTSLYDYLHDAVDLPLRRRIETHLTTCRTCRDELLELQEISERMKRPSTAPSAERGEEFWKAFPYAVERQIANAVPVTKATGLREFIRELMLYRRRSASLLAGGLALGILLGIFSLKKPLPPSEPPAMTQNAGSESQAAETQAVPVIEVDRMQKYFRKSKMLLVGVENMHLDESKALDLSVERNASRELLHEARYLKNQPLDNRSAKLIGDLEKILIELATIKEETGLQNVEIVRGGIHQENLLFKIRMAEALFDTTRFMKTRYVK